MSHLSKSPIYLATLVLIVLGIASQKQATALPQEPLPPAKPELINLYFAELNRSHCDHLVVAILQGTLPSTKSKEGVVVDLFPPTNDGTRTDTGGGKPSGSVDSTPGAVSYSSSRSNRPSSTDTDEGDLL